MNAIDTLSKTTTKDGKGADAYAESLSSSFSRWTIGSDKTSNKSEWVEGVRGWFDEGWYVASRKQQFVEITVVGDTAYSRRIVTETYGGPKGESNTSKAALAEVWKKEGGRWLLRRVDVHPVSS